MYRNGTIDPDGRNRIRFDRPARICLRGIGFGAVEGGDGDGEVGVALSIDAVVR